MAKTEELGWANVVVRVGLNSITHPIEYAKILIQVGHEPLPAYKSKTIFGTEKFFYPSIFSYIQYIKKRDGFVGCYRGLTPKLGSNIISGLAYQHVTEAIIVKNDDKESEDLSDSEKQQRFLMRTARETAGRCAAVLASQPLHVIAVRAMAEFVAEESNYSNVFWSFGVIYREDGWRGFFAGIVPRLVCDIGALWLSNSLVFVVNNYLVEDKDIKTYVAASFKFLASSVLYPLQVVSTCMAVSGSGVAAGRSPQMPEFTSWVHCFKHLSATKCIKRGSTLLWRTYTGPLIMNLAGFPTIPDHDLFVKPQKYD